MKRVGHLIERIATRENLYEAFLRAARGKRAKAVVREFEENLEDNLTTIAWEMSSGNLHVGNYHYFTIYDPKERIICAASFRDRVVFHAIMRICHPVFDDYQVHDSYASRPGKGTHKALARAQQYCRRYRWFAKLDVCKFFDSIDHGIVMNQLSRLIKDPLLLQYFAELLDSYEVLPGKGVPIGNLTSQYFANHYLSCADHYAKEELRVLGMVRYMDDVLFFDNDPRRLKRNVMAYSAYVEQHLLLSLHPTVMNTTRRGIPFLGYVVRGNYLRLNERSVRRLRHKMCRLTQDLENDIIDQNEYATRATALLAFASRARIQPLLRQMSATQGMYPSGL